MPVSAVCISRAIGAGGEEVGRLVADALGFRYLDEEIVLAAAEQEGLDPEQLARVERRRKGLSRLEVDIVTGGAFDEIQRSLIRGAVQQAAAAGKVVIVAHAASLALSGDDRVLRVLVTASPDVRAERLLQTEQLEEHEAIKRIDAILGFAATEDSRVMDVQTRNIGPSAAAVYSCSTRMGVSGRHLSVACLRRRAWMLVFSSAEMTNSSSFKALPSHSRAYKSSIRLALVANSGSRGKIQLR